MYKIIGSLQKHMRQNPTIFKTAGNGKRIGKA